MTFSPTQRLLAVAQGQAVDRPPCICPGGMMNMMFREIMEKSGCCWPEAHTDPEKMAGLAVGLRQAGGFENYGLPFCMTLEAEALGVHVDMGDMLCEPHAKDALLASPGDWPSLQPLSTDRGRIACVLTAARALKQRNDGVPLIGNLTGPVSLAGTLADMGDLLQVMRKNPQTADGLLGFAADQALTLGRALIEAGADAICIAEPSGTGEILGPRHFQRYTIPYLNRVLDALPPVVKIVHICGRLQNVYPFLSQIHCDIFSFDAIVPAAHIIPHLGSVAAMGNISAMALVQGQPERIRNMVRFLRTAGIGVVAPACGLSTLTPLANVQAMVEAAEEVF